MSHTPEPWGYGKGTGIIHSKHLDWRRPWAINVRDTARRYPDELEEANARRIVACVNACKHYSTDDLEDVGEHLSGAFYDATKRCSELVSQRDELLAVLEKVREDINWMLNSKQFLNPHVFDYLDLAIAKAVQS